MKSEETQVRNILLMGPRAAGKTSVGRALAERLRRTFLDLDVETLKAFDGSDSVSHAWRAHGEGAWREAEAAALSRALQSSGLVIALGGGTPMIHASRAMLTKVRDVREAVIVYLQSDAQTLQQRLRESAGDRPALRGDNAIDEVPHILREREPTYLELADFAVDARMDVPCVVDAIVARIVAPDRGQRGSWPE